MALRALRQCKKIGCKELTREQHGYCDTHKEIAEQKQAERNKFYDKNIRHRKDKKYTDFYHSTEWETVREYALSLYNNIDIYAYYIDKQILIANTVHHIAELKEDWDKGLDIYNLFPLSDSSHNKIHALYKKDKEGTQRLLIQLLKRWRKEFNTPLP